jgi:hypothetical protein
MKGLMGFAAAALWLGVCGGAQAQEQVVVSGSRINASDEAPNVTFTKRADFLITHVRVVCDTRDLSQRRQELKTTLRNMVRAAVQTPGIALGLGDEVIGALTEDNFDQIIEPDVRADTSRAQVIIKTAITANDSFDGATARINAYIAKTPKAGRTEILRDKDWGLTIVSPEQYRDNLITRIVADAKHSSELFGQDYNVRVTGLERRVAWVQRGPLDLALYIPYGLEVLPRGAR